MNSLRELCLQQLVQSGLDLPDLPSDDMNARVSALQAQQAWSGGGRIETRTFQGDDGYARGVHILSSETVLFLRNGESSVRRILGGSTLEPAEASPFQHEAPVQTFSVRSEQMLCGLQDGTVHVWDLEAEQSSQLSGQHRGSVVKVDQGTDFAVSAGRDVFKLWDLRSKKSEICDLKFPKLVSSFALQDVTLLCGHRDGTVSEFDLHRREVVGDYSCSEANPVTDVVAGRDWMASIAGNTLRVWERSEKTCVAELHTEHLRYSALGYDSGSQVLLAGSAEGELTVFDGVSRKTRWANVADGGYTITTLHKNGGMIACGDNQGTILLHSLSE